MNGVKSVRVKSVVMVMFLLYAFNCHFRASSMVKERATVEWNYRKRRHFYKQTFQPPARERRLEKNLSPLAFTVFVIIYLFIDAEPDHDGVRTNSDKC